MLHGVGEVTFFVEVVAVHARDLGQDLVVHACHWKSTLVAREGERHLVVVRLEEGLQLLLVVLLAEAQQLLLAVLQVHDVDLVVVADDVGDVVELQLNWNREGVRDVVVLDVVDVQVGLLGTLVEGGHHQVVAEDREVQLLALEAVALLLLERGVLVDRLVRLQVVEQRVELVALLVQVDLARA